MYITAAGGIRSGAGLPTRSLWLQPLDGILALTVAALWLVMGSTLTSWRGCACACACAC